MQTVLQRYYSYVSSANLPATAEALSALTHRRTEEGECAQQEKCTLCLEELQRGEHVTQLPCGHVFHQTRSEEAGHGCEGVSRWLRENRTCPQCRVPVVASGEVPTDSEQLLIPLILKQYKLIREQQRMINSFLQRKRQGGRRAAARRRGGMIRNRSGLGARAAAPFAPSLRLDHPPAGWQVEFLRSDERSRVLAKVWMILFSQLKQEAQGNLNAVQSDKLDRISKRIESLLFTEAQTFEAYSDDATLQTRTMRKLYVIMKMCRYSLAAHKAQAQARAQAQIQAKAQATI